jgi:hypothetical protein
LQLQIWLGVGVLIFVASAAALFSVKKQTPFVVGASFITLWLISGYVMLYKHDTQLCKGNTLVLTT